MNIPQEAMDRAVEAGIRSLPMFEQDDLADTEMKIQTASLITAAVTELFGDPVAWAIPSLAITATNAQKELGITPGATVPLYALTAIKEPTND